jgi:transcriptional/translational regulatory protein YebC/TACO1
LPSFLSLTISKVYGPDPNSNPRLALAIATAKKAGVPKGLIEAAIARGQGVSASGTTLENVVVEAIFPPGVATVIDCQTDNKLKTLADIRLLIKVHQGSVTPTNYLFQRKGRVVLSESESLDDEQMLEAALEAGALDVEDVQGKTIVFTEVNATKAIAKTLAESLGVEIEEAEISWCPNEETMVSVDNGDDVQNMAQFIEKMHDQISGLQAIYHNASPSETIPESWSAFQSRVASS